MGGTATEKMVELPVPHRTGGMSVEAALAARRSVREFESAPLSLEQVGQLLWAAQGITHSPGLRAAPSASALYPLEIYAVCANVGGLAPGIYHYLPAKHRLERVADGDRRVQLAQAALGQGSVRTAPAVLVFAGVVERTAQKYGARAERYVDIEVGHAAENVALQAVALGLAAVPVGAFDDEAAARAVGIGEQERVRYLMPVGRPADAH